MKDINVFGIVELANGNSATILKSEKDMYK